MKQIIYIYLLFILPVLGLAQGKKQVWTQTDRQYLLAGLKTTQSNFLQEVEGLTMEQIHFKPDSSQWSVAEVMEHLGIYEELLYWDLLNNQYTDERPDLVDSVKGIDSIMIVYSTDPNKGQAPFIAQPIGRFKEKEDLVNFFTRFRKEVIILVQDTKVDFRLHFIFRPPDWGVWHIRDLHQYTLLWIAHTERHLNQIIRIKSNPRFPN
ncbi:MAG TPA: DinB family protein [Saprospiraceae bacterium]|nr:DinB family protein [Saprospiraceae bacterium]HRK80914.1 DinB family protein [Saprospiraceae bacterium]